MKYCKSPLSIDDQVQLLESRGLVINNIANLSGVLPYKPYAVFVIIRYLLNVINPNNQFNVELMNVVDSCNLISEKEMGFPKNWQTESFWR